MPEGGRKPEFYLNPMVFQEYCLRPVFLGQSWKKG